MAATLRRTAQGFAIVLKVNELLQHLQGTEAVIELDIPTQGDVTSNWSAVPENVIEDPADPETEPAEETMTISSGNSESDSASVADSSKYSEKMEDSVSPSWHGVDPPSIRRRAQKAQQDAVEQKAQQKAQRDAREKGEEQDRRISGLEQELKGLKATQKTQKEQFENQVNDATTEAHQASVKADAAKLAAKNVQEENKEYLRLVTQIRDFVKSLAKMQVIHKKKVIKKLNSILDDVESSRCDVLDGVNGSRHDVLKRLRGARRDMLGLFRVFTSGIEATRSGVLDGFNLLHEYYIDHNRSQKEDAASESVKKERSGVQATFAAMTLFLFVCTTALVFAVSIGGHNDCYIQNIPSFISMTSGLNSLMLVVAQLFTLWSRGRLFFTTFTLLCVAVMTTYLWWETVVNPVTILMVCCIGSVFLLQFACVLWLLRAHSHKFSKATVVSHQRTLYWCLLLFWVCYVVVAVGVFLSCRDDHDLFDLNFTLLAPVVLAVSFCPTGLWSFRSR